MMAGEIKLSSWRIFWIVNFVSFFNNYYYFKTRYLFCHGSFHYMVSFVFRMADFFCVICFIVDRFEKNHKIRYVCFFMPTHWRITSDYNIVFFQIQIASWYTCMLFLSSCIDFNEGKCWNYTHINCFQIFKEVKKCWNFLVAVTFGVRIY